MHRIYRTLTGIVLVIYLTGLLKLQGADATNHSEVSLKNSSLISELELFKATQPEQLSIAVDSFKDKIKNAPLGDPWISKCEYTIGVALYNNNDYVEAINAFDRCLDAKETFPGDHIYAQQMKMLSLTGLKRFEDAARVAEKIIQTPAPKSIKELLVPRAILLAAQMRIDADKGDGKQRALAEKNFNEALSNTNITDLLSADELKKMEEGTVRQRIQNCLVLGETNQAAIICKDFLKKYPTNYYAPLIALDLKRIIRGRLELPVSDLKEISQTYDLNSGAGANVIYDLAVVSANKGDWQAAIEAAQKIISMKLSNDDPMPISSALISESIKIRTVSYIKTGRTNDAVKSAAELNEAYSSQIKYNLTNDIPSNKELGLHKSHVAIRAVMLTAILLPPLIIIFRAIKKRGSKSPIH